mmetsp:Transcript_21280/g.49375  ORF Transcript_21280/g.49375 Transcript_21280/m.49375 type:complete len:533 (-) Transcript_21280:148-1746(-)
MLLRTAVRLAAWIFAAQILCLHSSASSQEAAKCGCSWTRAGCGISTRQLITGLAYSPVNKMCQETPSLGRTKGDTSWASRECRARKKVLEVLPAFDICEELTADKCRDVAQRTKECQWGAQATGKCGIDEEELLVRVLRDSSNWKAVEHPLVQLIRAHDQCSRESEHTCEADEKCIWHEIAGGARHCDLNMMSFYTTLLEHPSILVLLDTISASSRCRAMYEHGNPPTCTGACKMHEGICMLGSDELATPRFPPETMIDAICQTEVGQHQCPAPCVRGNSSMNYECRAPATLPESFSQPRLTETDWSVIEVFYAFSSATMVYEYHCNQLGSQAACMDASRHCSQSYVPEWESQQGELLQNPVPPGPGLNGDLGRFIAALEGGDATSHFEEYLQSNPGDVMQIVEKLSKGLQKFVVEDRQRQAARATPAPARQKPEGEAPVKARSPFLSDAILWPIALGLLVVAAICGGVATGTLCHQGFAHWGFGEPGIITPEGEIHPWDQPRRGPRIHPWDRHRRQDQWQRPQELSTFIEE